MSVRDVIERMNCQFTCGDMGEPPCWQVAKRLDPPVKHVPCEQCIRATNISLSILDAAGYAVVPKEPTEAMRRAWWNAYLGLGVAPKNVNDSFPVETYRAMIAAAKEKP